MEMMIVLLIVAIIAAASAPMVSKKMMRDAEGGSPWMYAGLGGSITYNPDGNQNKTAMIGCSTIPSNADKAKFYVQSGGDEPQMAIGRSGDAKIIKFMTWGSKCLCISDTKLESNQVSESTAMGYSAIAGPSSAAFGYNADARGGGATAIGGSTKAKGVDSTAVGYQSNANGSMSTSFGYNANASQTGCIALGSSSKASSNYAIALGSYANASGNNATALGCSSNAGGNSSIAIGDSVIANANNSIAIGRGSSAGYNAISIGTNITAGGAISIGRDIKKPSSCSIILGNASMQAGDNSITIGYGDNSQANHKAVAIGYESNATGLASVAVGAESHATSNYSIAIGSHCSSKYNSTNTIAMGLYSSAGSYSVAIGDRAKAYNSNAVAIGVNAGTTADKQIVLGTTEHTVYIPGRLVVGGNAYIGDRLENAQCLYLGMRHNDDSGIKMRKISMRGDLSGKNNDQNVFGDGTVSAIYGKSSDRRLKNVGEVFTGGLNKIKQLKVYNYTFKEDENKTPRVGVMAQDLQKVFPDAVTKGDNGFLRIRFEDMFYALVNAVKELDTKFTALNDRIKQLEEQNKQLEKQNKELEKRLSKLEKSFTTK